MEQPPAKRHNAGYNPPPQTAVWEQTLARDHTDPQPLPDQSLTCTFKDGTKKVLVARTREWARLVPPPYRGSIEYIRPRDGGPILVTVLRGYDGARGQLLAVALEKTFGVDVLSGKGSKNKCSYPLEDRRITTDMGNYDSCSLNGDLFIKLLPLLGAGHGGNFDGDSEHAAWVTPLLDAALAAAGRPAAPAHVGSVQIIRYRAAGCKLPPKKTHKSALTFYKAATKYDARAGLGDNAANGDVIKHQNEQWKALDAATRRPYEALAEVDRARGDSLHMHVDQDKHASNVLLLALGDTRRMVFCRGAKCRRLACCDKVPGLAAARAAMPKGLAKDRALDELNAAKAAWRTADCKSCAEFDFKSGDVLVFDGSPAADVAHGVLDTLAGTGPAELPDWAKGCAVSLQYRQRRK